jgi:hypothetical protein
VIAVFEDSFFVWVLRLEEGRGSKGDGEEEGGGMSRFGGGVEGECTPLLRLPVGGLGGIAHVC